VTHACPMPTNSDLAELAGCSATACNLSGPLEACRADIVQALITGRLRGPQGCLQWLPSERLTADQALQHEWVTGRPAAAV